MYVHVSGRATCSPKSDSVASSFLESGPCVFRSILAGQVISHQGVVGTSPMPMALGLTSLFNRRQVAGEPP